MTSALIALAALLGAIAAEITILRFVLGRAARGMVAALSEYQDAQADLRAARRETVRGGYLIFPPDVTAAQRAEAVRRFDEAAS